jgi:OOP family OmpA-OmpF porin
MSDPVSSPLRRYRRRILVWGLLAVVVLCAVAAPLFLRSVEDDLEHRVPSELADRGFVGVTAAFSGQDGVLRCAAPLAEPEDAIDAAIDVWGVRAIELDRSCRVGGSSPDGTDDASSASSLPSDSDTVTSSSPPSTTDVAPDASDASDFGSIVDVVTSGPQFSILASLIDEADAAETLSGSGPFTLFAPSDQAFEELPPDTLAALRQDPRQLATLLQHHVVAGSYLSSELEPGPIEMLDGTTLSVRVTDDTITIGGATIIEPDLEAANGVVHVIDHVLLPRPVPTEPDDRAPTVSATLAAGQLVLEGEVADETQRAILLDGASRALDPANVDDELTIALDTEIDDDTVRSLAELVAMMPPSLVSGESGYDGTELYTVGVFTGNDRRTAYLAVADFVAATVELAPRPSASGADARALEDELNAFVLANPIQFPPASADLPPAVLAVLDRLAGIAEQFDGVTITIEGHTDSDGEPDENQVLSAQRAGAVLVNLVARGVPVADLTAVGLGSTQPMLVGGVEDKDASRRVEFRGTVEPGA